MPLPLILVKPEASDNFCAYSTGAYPERQSYVPGNIGWLDYDPVCDYQDFGIWC